MKIVRIPLAEQTARALDRALRTGAIGRVLPSERRLCAEMGISRPVLRQALDRLEREGMLSREGRRRVAGERHHPRTEGDGPSTVRMLISGERSAIDNDIVGLKEIMAGELHELGVGFRVEIAPACFGPEPARRLEALTASVPNSLWILLRSTLAMQRWFEAARLPTVVSGSCFPGIQLPSVDADHAAVCRHAAGALLARGHRTIALLAPRNRLPGDEQGIQGFENGLQRDGGREILLLRLAHDGHRDSVAAAIDRALGRPRPPTAIFIFGSLTYLAAATHLAARGRVPGREISLLCRDFDPFMDDMIPGVAHYRRNTRRFCRQVLAVVRDVLGGRAPRPAHRLVMAEFHPGQSLGPAS